MNPFSIFDWTRETLSGEAGEPAVPPAVVVEIQGIAAAFSADYSPIKLLPHEWRQLRRIIFLSRRDEKRAKVALRLFKMRASAARAALRPRVH